ncbi:hypothetical protein LSCM1_07180 [Leishmania martiniquensis]|uniref:Atg6 BARA domain-containing protein n=1 Tax=Leishmania martiniquensis TaxID=1580590 RepID=A0A836L1T9_9TRYP|nr:hypothetical protein LSCM1_07180 [Leishmania martiniquensis]
MGKAASDGPSSTSPGVAHASDSRVAAPPSAAVAPRLYAVNPPPAPGTQGVMPSMARSGGDVVSSASALRFTCCRCRRPLVVRPAMQRSAVPVLRSPHEPASVSVGPAVAVEGPPLHPLRLPSPLSAVQGAVRDSHATRGTGRLFRPLEPPVTAVGEGDHTVRCEDTCEDAADIPPAVVSTGIFEECDRASYTSSTQLTDEALLNELPPHFFSSAELLTSSQLADLLSRAQESCAAAATTSMCVGMTSATDGPLTASPAPQAVSTAASPLVTPVPTEATVLSVWELASLGVPVHSSTIRQVGDDDENGHAAARSGTSLDESVSSTQEASSSNVADGHSDLSSAPADERGSARTGASPHISPQASSSCTLPPLVYDKKRACGALPPLGSATPPAARMQPARTLSVDKTFAGLPPSTLSFSPGPPEPATTSHLDLGISIATPAGDPLGTVPFDELCRRWMRLLAHTAVPHEQPLCMDCWRDACLAPLQQRTRRSLEGTKALAAMMSSTLAEKLRLFTMCHTAPPMAPSREAGITSAELRRNSDEQEARQAFLSSATVEASNRGLPLMSLDAVAANLFGSEEERLLRSLEALSAPHGESLPITKGAATARNTLLCATGAPLEPCDAPQPDNGEGASTRASFRRDAEKMTAELERLAAEQVSLERQVAELRDELHALESAADLGSRGDGHAAETLTAPPSDVAPQGWHGLAVAHNIHEVQRAFTIGDEAAERQRAIDDLVERFAYVSTTPVDDLCFPIDVSGPVGLIAGLRLGLVLPYSGSHGGRAGAGSGNVRSDGATVASTTSTVPPLIPAPLPVSEECMHLHGFVSRQVGYTQLLLSGHTSTDCSDGDSTAAKGCRDSGGGAHRGLSSGEAAAISATLSPPADAAATVASATPASTAVAKVKNTRVSPLEVNAACGYLLLLLSYLAQVNGFAFRTAVLRPAGDRSTLALLKRVPASASAAHSGGGATQSIAASPFPLNIFSLFTRRGVTGAPPKGSGKLPQAMGTAPSVAYVVDHEVDFYLTDRLLAWRTFGAACVAVAACVTELSDALHESLRCWRMRESMFSQPASCASPTQSSHEAAAAVSRNGESVSAASYPAARPASADVSGSLESSNDAVVCAACSQQPTPVPLPQLVQELCSRAGHRNSSGKHDSCAALPKSTGALGTFGRSGALPAEGNSGSRESASASSPQPSLQEGIPKQCCGSSAAAGGTFPLQPPFRAHGDTVDGFSVRHGSVSEATWTLGMKKLLANVRWCMEATVELERLYAVIGEADGDGAGAELDEDGRDVSGKVRTIAGRTRE